MTVDEDDLLVDELVGDRDGLLGVAGVVADLQDQLLAVDAALGVDVLHRHLGTVLHLHTEDGVLAGERPGDGDHGVGPCRHRRGGGERRGAQEEQRESTHPWGSLLIVGTLKRLKRSVRPGRPGRR